MVIGLVLFSWDPKTGPVLDVKYPETLEVSESLIQKIYMTHSYSQDFEKEELIETHYEDQIIFSYCDKSRVPSVGYEILVLIVHEKEKFNSYNLRRQILEFTKKIFQSTKIERNKVFLDNIETFFKKTSAKKILLLGRAGTGKTSIKQIVFEGKDPKDLLYNPLEPTRGITPSVYSWLDLNLGLFDSSGQELQYLLNEETEQRFAFDGADAIIYIFDFKVWTAKSQEIINEIQKILNIIKEKSYKSRLIIFFHKIDLIDNDIKEEEINKIRNIVQNQLNLQIYFTSIYPGLIYSLYNAFCEILSSFSEETVSLKNILDEKIEDLSKIMCFVTDQNNSIIVQTMSNDFNTTLINHSHKLIVQLNQTFEDMSENQIDHLIISSANDLNIIMNNLNLKKFNFKNLICISETLGANKLIFLVGQIRTELNRYLYLNK